MTHGTSQRRYQHFPSRDGNSVCLMHPVLRTSDVGAVRKQDLGHDLSEGVMLSKYYIAMNLNRNSQDKVSVYFILKTT